MDVIPLHKRRWFSGRMLACHAGDPGSIPGRRNRRWFSGRMLACHAGDPGSIPGRRSVNLSCFIRCTVYEKYSNYADCELC
ncbi:hypothetical protein TTRE_0000546101 [Trichuris trichiura]|uniref:Uncharacterized protein n=1 Tax=Trichuris trichiura TaxID=36087 RepID=A0A077ZAB4_TRITR|nr:hypothetical protein TTRE_0000546101 [Trichuris trichiura]